MFQALEVQQPVWYCCLVLVASSFFCLCVMNSNGSHRAKSCPQTLFLLFNMINMEEPLVLWACVHIFMIIFAGSQSLVCTWSQVCMCVCVTCTSSSCNLHLMVLIWCLMVLTWYSVVLTWYSMVLVFCGPDLFNDPGILWSWSDIQWSWYSVFMTWYSVVLTWNSMVLDSVVLTWYSIVLVCSGPDLVFNGPGI